MPTRREAPSSTKDAEYQRLVQLIEPARLPRHVAIIMDGNGRWARERGLPRVAGHRAGVEALRGVVRTAGELGVPVLTVYAFSTENWKRPRHEIDALMNLIVEYLRKYLDELCSNQVHIRVLGDLDPLPAPIRRQVDLALERTRDHRRMTLAVAWNYGGRADIVKAVRQLAREVAAGRVDPEAIDEACLGRHLDTAGLPDPDLLIRCSGELRISNFLLWELAYTELWFTPVYWPDFDRVHLAEAILEYQRRRRRFGGLEGPDPVVPC